MSDDPSTIGAGQGTVHVRGTARVAEQSFTSPLTEQECVAYRLEKEVKRTQVRGGTPEQGTNRRKRWQTIHVEEGGAPFYVENDRGSILVDGTTANLDVGRSYTFDSADFEDGLGEKVVAAVIGREPAVPDAAREVASDYVEEVRDSEYPRRYTEWVIHDGDTVDVRGAAVAPEQTAIGSSLAAGMDGSTEPATGGLVGSLKSAVGIATQLPADPRARYVPRAIERLPDVDRNEAAAAIAPGSDLDDSRVRDVCKTVSIFEGLVQGELSESPTVMERIVEEVGRMSRAERQVADAAMPDAPAMDRESVVISWGQDETPFVVSDDV